MRTISTLLTMALLTIINGTNAFAWTISTGFENGTLGQVANSAPFLAFSQTVFSNGVVNSGTRSAQAFFTQGSDTFGQSGGQVVFPSALGEGSELWARGYFYFQSPWSWQSSPVSKIFRVAHVATSSGANVGYLSIFNTGGNITLSNEPGNVQPVTAASFDVGSWQCLEVYVRLSATQPIFRIWKNGKLLIEDRTNKTLNSSTDVADFSYLFSYWNGGVPQNQVAYIDDLVYTTTTPSNTDANGNRMIGMAGAAQATPSLPPPSNLVVQ